MLESSGFYFEPYTNTSVAKVSNFFRHSMDGAQFIVLLLQEDCKYKEHSYIEVFTQTKRAFSDKDQRCFNV